MPVDELDFFQFYFGLHYSKKRRESIFLEARKNMYQQNWRRMAPIGGIAYLNGVSHLDICFLIFCNRNTKALLIPTKFLKLPIVRISPFNGS